MWRRLVDRLHPNRTIRPTREGWWCLAVTMGLGLTALNTGNNLLYLLESMVLALIIVSGLLSEQSVRGVRVAVRMREEIFAGMPFTVAARVHNTKARRPSYSVGLERPWVKSGPWYRHRVPADAELRLAYLPRLGPDEERIVTWQEVLPERGRHRTSGVRVVTRFPFGLFTKFTRPEGAEDVLVYPRRVPAPPALLREAGGDGSAPARRRGRGHDLHDLRAYQAGDDRRMIHWRVTARTGALTVRELEAETAQDACLVLHGDGRRDSDRLEQALAEAAAVVDALLARGARVGLVAPGVEVSLGYGASHRRQLLTALALYTPTAASPARAPAGARPVIVNLE